MSPEERDPSAIVLEHVQDKVAVLDEHGRFGFVNAAVERILGFSPERLRGEIAFEYVHPDDREAVVEAFEATVGATGFDAETVTYRHRTAAGGWVWLESRMSNLSDTGLDGYVVSSRDVTDRVEAKRARRESETRLQELATTTDDVLWMVDGDWTEVLFCNPAYEELFGRPVETLEADPRSFLECVHPEDRPAVETALDQLTDGERTSVEYRIGAETGYDRWVWVRGEPIVEDGKVTRIVGFCRDVTARRRRERQLVVMDNFLRHNIRNEMNVIIGNVDLVEAEAVGETAERMAVIRRAGQRLVETAEKQREVIRILTRPARTHRLDLTAVIDRAVETATDRYPALTVRTELPETMPIVGLDELEAAVVELLENAVEHNDPATVTVTLDGRYDGSTAVLTVRDTGVPIPAFDAQVLTGDDEMGAIYHSTGFGLRMVYWIVDAAGGQVTYTRRDGENVVEIALQRSGGAHERESDGGDDDAHVGLRLAPA